MSEFKTVRGMRDFLPDEAELLKYVEGKAREIARLYGFREIITPVVEPYELLSSKAGEEVRSRMFVFKDLGGRNVALRPEFTASVARFVATTLRTEPKPFRLYSSGSIYRYDEPQKGRYREFWQSNYELMGSGRPEADVEILMLTDSLMRTTGLRKFAFKIGHVGVFRGIFNQENIPEKIQNTAMQFMDKKQYDEALTTIKDAGASQKSLDVLYRLVELKGTDVLDIVGKIQDTVTQYGEASRAAENLASILRLVSESGKDLDILVDAGFARGLEYYTGMICEVYVPDLNIALGGGGRYDKLIALFGGEPTPALGIAHGLDRIMLAMQGQKVSLPPEKEKLVIAIPVRPELMNETLRIAQILRDKNVRVEVEVAGRKVSKALEYADKRKIDYAIIVGEKELREKAVVVRDLHTRDQKTVKIETLAQTLRS